MRLFGAQGSVDDRAEESAMSAKKMEEDMPMPVRPRPNAFITKGITVEGVLRGEGVIQVEGAVEGEIDLQGSVIVLVGGTVRGPVSADVIQVAGLVEGSVTARKHLRLERTGTMDGDLATPSLVVEDGGRLNGRTSMLQPPPEPLPPVSGQLHQEQLAFGPGYQPDKDP